MNELLQKMMSRENAKVTLPFRILSENVMRNFEHDTIKY